MYISSRFWPSKYEKNNQIYFYFTDLIFISFLYLHLKRVKRSLKVLLICLFVCACLHINTSVGVLIQPYLHEWFFPKHLF